MGRLTKSVLLAVLGTEAVVGAGILEKRLESYENLPKTYAVITPRSPEIRKSNRYEARAEEAGDAQDYESVYDMIRRHEGLRTRVYRDSRGNRTIGIGFNLENRGARREIESVGANYEEILSGRARLNERQVEALFRRDVEEARQTARSFLGRRNYDRLDERAKDIITDMAFNLGPSRLNRFRRLRRALIRRDYLRAADEMEDSRWYGQVGNRSRELVRRMRALSSGRAEL